MNQPTNNQQSDSQQSESQQSEQQSINPAGNQAPSKASGQTTPVKNAPNPNPKASVSQAKK